MGTYTTTITWTRGADEPFTDNKYSRGHDWAFDSGVKFRGSSSPHVVPKYSDPAGVDPEEAFVASLASCHMLTFLHMAARQGFVVDRYEDTAEGVMTKNAMGKLFISVVTLRPKIAWGGAAPDAATLGALHHAAHEECFIANSVLTEVRVEPAA
ncbi:MAG: OsmC family protein [Hyphomicrobiales bacterium]